MGDKRESLFFGFSHQEVKKFNIIEEASIVPIYCLFNPISSYPIEKFFLINRQIQGWQDYVTFGLRLAEA